MKKSNYLIILTIAFAVILHATDRHAFHGVSAAADGDLDPAFGAGGIVTTDLNGNSPDVGNGVVVQSDGKIIVAGSTVVTGQPAAIGLTRYNSDGSLDTSFDSDGKVTTTAGAGISGEAVALQADGKIVVAGVGRPAGQSDFDFVVARYNANGSLDTSFDSTGVNITRFSTFDDVAQAVAIQDDGKIVVAGQSFTAQTGGTSLFAVARYNTNGSLDSTFGGGTGKVTTSFAAGAADARAVFIQPDGKIVAAGTRNLARYMSDGTLDTTFGGAGRVLINVQGININAAALQPDGNILAAGFGEIAPANSGFAVVRLTAEGVFDNSFNGTGRSVIDVGPERDEAYALTLQPNGKIILAGGSNFTPVFALARFNSNGTLDTSFSGDGIATTPFPISNSQAHGVVLQADGKIIAPGRAGIGQTGDVAVARYQNDGGSSAVPRPRQFDFDGDDKDDFSVFRPSEGNWYIQRSTQGLTVFNWGLAGDRLTPADFDGDGKTDVAVWREAAQSTFFIFQSGTNTVRIDEFGVTGDQPSVVADFDGDGKADPAVYREGAQSMFFYRGSANNPAGNITFLPWGTSGDKPVRGDFDGDGTQDAGVFRPSSAVWMIRRSSDGALQPAFWGISSDLTVDGDFDGDGKTDPAVFRATNSTWYVLQSSNGQASIQQWGTISDRAAPADYDGDGRTDIAIWRPSDGNFWVLHSSTSGASVFRFGAVGDEPIPAAFVK